MSGGETTMKLGSLLDDQHWHQFRLDRYRKYVNFSLDGEVLQFRLNGEFEQLDLDREVICFGRIYTVIMLIWDVKFETN